MVKLPENGKQKRKTTEEKGLRVCVSSAWEGGRKY